jgi:mono/diheme cytochrome c family protein
LRRAIGTGAIVCALLASSALGVRAQLDDTLRFPGGPAKAQIVANCQACHSVGLIAQQRLSLIAWTNELVKMEKWGATLSPDQNAAVAAYLFKNFNPEVPDAPGRLVRAPR